MVSNVFKACGPMRWEPSGWMDLIENAKAVRENAHVPHSNFPVGAALLTDSGKMFLGCNVENAAFPQGLCAEAGAIAAMCAAGERTISRLVVVAGSSLVTPCGGCRQKIAEFASSQTEILMVSGDLDTGWLADFEDLLPGAFSSRDME